MYAEKQITIAIAAENYSESFLYTLNRSRD